MSFQDLARLSIEVISKQPPVTLEEARAQAIRIKTQNCTTLEEAREIARQYWETIKANETQLFGISE